MKKFKTLAILLAFVFAFGVFSGLANAETQLIADCAEYYKFQSVKVELKTDKLEYAPGETIKFSGSIINTNNYPIVDGYIYVRLAKKNLNYVTEGHNIIDEFFGVEEISIDALKDKSVSFEWQAPSSIAGGNFTASFFFSTGKKFDLAGLPYTNDVIGGSADFVIKTTNYQEISFDRSKTKINGQPYSHIGQPPVFEVGSSTIAVTQSIKNTYKEPKIVKVKYELFSWSGEDVDQDKISSKTEEVVLSGKSSRDLVYKLEKLDLPSYSLKITATSGDDKSIVNIRFGSNLDRPRLRFLTLTNFPLKKGESTDIFACFSNTSVIDTRGKVIITLYDKNDTEIAKLDYAGVVPASVVASKKEFVADKDYTYLKLKAEVYDTKDSLVDKYEGAYDCRDLLSGKCKEMEVVVPVNSESKSSPAPKSSIIVSGVILVILIILILILVKRKNAAEAY